MAKLTVTIRNEILANGIESRRIGVCLYHRVALKALSGMKTLLKEELRRSVIFGFTNSLGILSTYMIVNEGKYVLFWKLCGAMIFAGHFLAL